MITIPDINVQSRYYYYCRQVNLCFAQVRISRSFECRSPRHSLKSTKIVEMKWTAFNGPNNLMRGDSEGRLCAINLISDRCCGWYDNEQLTMSIWVLMAATSSRSFHLSCKLISLSIQCRINTFMNHEHPTNMIDNRIIRLWGEFHLSLLPTDESRSINNLYESANHICIEGEGDRAWMNDEFTYYMCNTVTCIRHIIPAFIYSRRLE